ncbi:MAG: 5-formyltetrahydrofolate cyclo-ligase [Gammaproteobacteria bacterium]|nr:5-formyltetrahydrofolate cyclo-ligase [Gammaproteobacteria bacterium]
MEFRDPALTAQKQALRPTLLQRREILSAADRTAWSKTIESRVLALPEVERSKNVFCFISHGPEVNTHGILNGLLSQGKTVLVPKILRGEPMRAVRFLHWAELAPGTLGIPAPANSAAFDGHIDVVIAPGLAFTPDGIRIGYGRGYYDRWFATHAHGLRVGIVFDAQVQSDLPADADDIRMHMLITEQRQIRIPAAD